MNTLVRALPHLGRAFEALLAARGGTPPTDKARDTLLALALVDEDGRCTRKGEKALYKLAELAQLCDLPLA